MSHQASIAKLPSPLKDLITAASSSLSEGKIEADKKEVTAWIDQVVEGKLVEDLTALDTTLTPKTYAVSNYLTAADASLYAALHPVISSLPPATRFTYPSVTRYFNHIQSSSPIRTAADSLSAFPVIEIDLSDAPALTRVAEPAKKKEKKPAAVPAEGTPAAATETTPVAAEEGAKDQAVKTSKKEKKEKTPKEGAAAEGGKKKEKGGGGKAAPAAEEGSGEPVPSMIDLRVGHIVDIKKHPDADGLYVEQIDIGEETGPRTVVSGLVNYIPIEDMRDKYLVAVCNLKPANMRGVKSFAMVLCATSKDGKEGGIELIQPPANSKPGDRVFFEGADFENATPLSQLNPKKKIFETVQPGFITLESKEAAWVDPKTKSVHRIRTKEGICIAPTLVGASLS